MLLVFCSQAQVLGKECGLQQTRQVGEGARRQIGKEGPPRRQGPAHHLRGSLQVWVPSAETLAAAKGPSGGVPVAEMPAGPDAPGPRPCGHLHVRAPPWFRGYSLLPLTAHSRAPRAPLSSASMSLHCDCGCCSGLGHSGSCPQGHQGWHVSQLGLCGALCLSTLGRQLLLVGSLLVAGTSRDAWRERRATASALQSPDPTGNPLCSSLWPRPHLATKAI